ncbi:MAG: DUF4954 family protein [Planctomycetota bacterium]|nr:DUF4954 family protein [Planctomycetota bacterium]
MRDQQGGPGAAWRPLTPNEIDALVRHGNRAADWGKLLVTDPFTPELVRNCQFEGLVRLGKLEPVTLWFHDFQTPAGLTSSRLVECDIGDDSAIYHVRYLAHYIVGARCILMNIDEMHCTNHAKFGNGIVKDGESEDVRVWLDLVNETGARRVLPFDGMTAGDAYLWARFREDRPLMDRLKEITQKQFGSRRGYYGLVADDCVIKSCRFIKDVRFGPSAYVKGANKLKNLTVNSSDEEPSQIGEGVELVNGIIARGCHVFYGCKAVRFVMGACSSLKYGARLIHSYLGDNSTVSCCEILNNLIFPSHEQHHNTSFLIASLLMGQSNLAAGATAGSNHNSRANDGELHAGRGFWPGLCANFKHSSRFASFVLAAKGDYPCELNVTLPFSLLSNDTVAGRLVIMPAYWWLYNMYALWRNAWKFRSRDKRVVKAQHVEFDPLAPDTAEEIIRAMGLLEAWTGAALAAREGADAADPTELARAGRALLTAPAGAAGELEILAKDIEKSERKVVVVRAQEAYEAYRQMLLTYAVTTLAGAFEAAPGATVGEMAAALGGPRASDWVNLGGQLIPAGQVDDLRAQTRSGELATWDDIHAAYDRLWQEYPRAKQRHAWATLLWVLKTPALTPRTWGQALERAVELQRLIAQRVHQSRCKDYEDSFRRAVFESPEEMHAVLGDVEDNTFIRQVREETDRMIGRLEALRQRG